MEQLDLKYAIQNKQVESVNNLNMMLTIHLGYIAMLADKIDIKLYYNNTILEA